VNKKNPCPFFSHSARVQIFRPTMREGGGEGRRNWGLFYLFNTKDGWANLYIS
jgi:hypothetical protein